MDDAGLLRAILDEPDDDTHRLVYADWLDETGRPGWAALIRAQCGLSRCLRPPDVPFLDAGLLPATALPVPLRRQVLACLGGLITPQEMGGPDSADELARVGAPGDPLSGFLRYECRLRRGLLEEVVIRGGGVRRFAEQAGQVFERAPLRQLVLDPRLPAVPFVYTPPTAYPAVVTEPVDPADVEALLRLPSAGRLRHLGLRAMNLTGPLRRVLLRCADALPHTTVWADGRRIVDGTPGLERLRQRLGARLILRPPWGSFPDDDIPF